jgi:hypothetical protein
MSKEDDDKAAAEAKAAEEKAAAEKSAVTPTAITPLAVNKGVAPSLNLAPNAGALAPKTFPSVLAAAPTEEESVLATVKADSEKGNRLAAERDAARKTAEQATETELSGKAKLEADKRAADAKADKEYLDSQQSRDIEAKKFRPEPFKPVPYKAPKKMNAVEQWGSSAMLFAMLGSLFTRNHAVTALNAAAAAMNGFKEGNEAVAKQALEEWKVSNQNMLDAANYQQKVYDNHMKDVQDRKQYEKERYTAEGRQRAADMEASAHAFGDTTKLAVLKSKNAGDAYDDWENSKKRLLSAEAETLRVQKLIDEAKYNAIAAKWTPNTPLEQKIAEAYASQTEKGRHEAEAFEKSIVFRNQQLEQKLKDLDNDPKYAEAKKKGDAASMLEMRAEAGSVPDQRKYADYLSRMSKKQLTPEELITQATNDRLIATYMREFPTAGRSVESKMDYDARMARVQALSQELTGKPYDPKLYDRESKSKQRWDDPQGYISRQMSSLNTLVGHLNETEDLVKASKGDNAAWLRVRNAYGKFIGGEKGADLANADLRAVTNITTDELARFVLGGATARGDREEMNALISADKSKTFNLRTIDVLKKYILKRAESYKEQYMAETGGDEDAFAKYLTPEALRTYGKELQIPQDTVKRRMEMDEAAAERAGKNATTAPVAASNAPAGATPGVFKIPSVGGYPAATVAEWVKTAKAMPGHENKTDEQLVEEFRKQAEGAK